MIFWGSLLGSSILGISHRHVSRCVNVPVMPPPSRAAQQFVPAWRGSSPRGTQATVAATPSQSTGPSPQSSSTDLAQPAAQATGPASVEVDSPVAWAAIKRDLCCCEARWSELCLLEVEAPYGAVSPKSSDILDLKRQGQCIPEVTLRRVRGCIEPTSLKTLGTTSSKVTPLS